MFLFHHTLCFFAGNDLPSWAPGAALVPALLATILFFMDQHITAIIVNRKDNKLKVNNEEWVWSLCHLYYDLYNIYFDPIFFY